jgi:hypothetical protein
MTDAAMWVRRISDGADDTSAGRQEFVRWFIRPCGVSRPAGEVVADLIETAARPRPGRAPMSEGARRDGIPGRTLASQGISR